MKKHIIVTGICSSLLLAFFLSSFEIGFQSGVQDKSYSEVSSEDEEYEPSSTEEEWEIT